MQRSQQSRSKASSNGATREIVYHTFGQAVHNPLFFILSRHPPYSIGNVGMIIEKGSNLTLHHGADNLHHGIIGHCSHQMNKFVLGSDRLDVEIGRELSSLPFANQLVSQLYDLSRGHDGETISA